MAIGKKRRSTTTRRKSTAAKSKTKKRRISGATIGNTVTIPGVGRFAKTGCFGTKSAAESAANSLRNPKSGTGALARVIKNGNLWCAFKGRKRKPGAVPARRG